MIEFIFTIDYEIYGNGEGSLRELVLEPTEQLMSVFKEWNSVFVVFAEALEFRRIQEFQADPSISQVAAQIRRLHEEGFEIGLHLHPWWYNARRENGCWYLDWSERNICASSPERMDEIVRSAIEYLREAVGDASFAPLSFRGGLWLMQPTKTLAEVLFRNGIQVDSSLFKGGRIKDLGLDYRPSLRNGWYWHFGDDINRASPEGMLLELPIHTELVPFWKMLSTKRLGLHRKVPAGRNGAPLQNRWTDFARFTYPRKLDFCRMNFDELSSAMNRILREERENPELYKPVVAIGHSKDLVDFETVKRFLCYLNQNGIPVSNLKTVSQKVRQTCIRPV